MNRFLPRALLAPAVVTLFLWMIVPLLMTLYFSSVRYNLMQPGVKAFIGLDNWIKASAPLYDGFVTDMDAKGLQGGKLLDDARFNKATMMQVGLTGEHVTTTAPLSIRDRSSKELNIWLTVRTLWRKSCKAGISVES